MSINVKRSKRHTPAKNENKSTASALKFHLICCLVLDQPRKTGLDMTEIVDWDIKNQLKQTNKSFQILRMLEELVLNKSHLWYIRYSD